MRDGFISVAAGTPKIRVADCRYNAEQIFTLMREADKQGVKVLALPELCLTGYTCGDLFLQDTLLRGAEDDAPLGGVGKFYLRHHGIFPVENFAVHYGIGEVFDLRVSRENAFP